MSYSCLEELQTILDLHMSDKTKVLSNAGYNKCNDGWFVVTDDGHCHLFGKDGNLDDIKKIKHLEEKYIRKDIKKIIIPNSVTSIGNYVFYYCNSLTSVTIPDFVTSIKDSVFYECTSLISVMIPDSVTSIGSHAFYNCSSLKLLVFKGKTLDQVKQMDNYPFGIEDESIIKCI